MGRSIIVYFTWSGTVKNMAQIIAGYADADMLEIEPEIPYSRDYQIVVEQVKNEVEQGKEVPSKNVNNDLSDYDTVYIGTPIWWGTLAPPLEHFLKTIDWSGKKVLPFCSHGGGGKTNSERRIREICKGAAFGEMFVAQNGGGSTINVDLRQWIDKVL